MFLSEVKLSVQVLAVRTKVVKEKTGAVIEEDAKEQTKLQEKFQALTKQLVEILPHIQKQEDQDERSKPSLRISICEKKYFLNDYIQFPALFDYVNQFILLDFRQKI
ncbi:unnamed protein product (macronuclear) [Paramecium tetraurelia]|uniref:Uncharacterized protein n=1 Tax=Paramecium tetraurelia TaxID=5888 RepID=A0D9P0_PARTE|nr:uncharacterized protein GSPATT00014688001 [Paramecium tetraurelia]CAK79757.1 unnamed protein product [Paramecium tetraurelia]|eukprot:XP_001447154.1 hypothetical protein (macronuclear) [Paramecium tetraurelia strain d4-2]